MRVDKFTAISYWFIHFSVEVLCFYVVGILFPEFSVLRWCSALLFDFLAFVTQPLIGTIFERYNNLKPGIIGGVLLILGSIISLILRAYTVFMILGLVIFSLGNAMIHICGAFSTGRVSEGKLSESAIFVAGGSFGVITGRMLASYSYSWLLAFIPAIISMLLMYLVDRRIRERYGDKAFDFVRLPLKHDIVNDRQPNKVILILAMIVIARGYIGYGLPTGWNKLSIHTIFLYCFMGLGKMLGGIFADLFGARNVGIVSCLLALPVLLASNDIMWLSLIGIALFSMTMAITLGGLFSVIKNSAGLAFGVTTVSLFLGSLPTFFMEMPSQFWCNILNIIMSVFATLGIIYCISNKREWKRED